MLTPGDVRAIDRILVPLRGDVNVDRIVRVVAELLDESDVTGTFYHAVGADEDPTESEFILRGASNVSSRTASTRIDCGPTRRGGA